VRFAFDGTQHNRSAHLRSGDAWKSDDVLTLVVGGEHVPTHGGRGLRWVRLADAPEGDFIYLGERAGQHYAAVMVDRVPERLEPASLRVIGPTVPAEEASLAVHGVGIARWHQRHTHCSNCGVLTRVADAGHSRACDACGAQHFPRTDPAVIMLITDDSDRALLGRQPVWPEGRFSTLAGFVEPGETLEDAVRREVAEEVGITVGDVEYAGSQPWPFPASLMVGFFGRAASTDIAVDRNEIAEAAWFTRDDMRSAIAAGDLMLPPQVSISRWLINTWLAKG
jgi:NAD+ diphosphatase